MIPIFALALFQTSAVRVVACDAPVQSRKRGVCANHLAAADFRALAPGVSWWYTWFQKPVDTPPTGTSMEFVPMVWGDRQVDLDNLSAYLAAGHRPRAVFAVNEPNLKGQAFISPETTAKVVKRTKAIADRFGIPTVGPHMALGSATDDSVTAYDPIEGKTTTYSFMVPFAKAVFHYAGEGATAGTGLHTYGNGGELRWAVGTMAKEFNRPVWLTEFNFWKAGSDREELEYMVQSVDFLERSPDVAGYAWFKERVDGQPRLGLLGAAPGALTPLGRAYVAMPVHDADLYYRLPGRLAAARYRTMAGAEIHAAPEEGTEMVAERSGATLDYNLQADATGAYPVRLRVSGPGGRIALTKRGVEIAGVDVPPGDGARTVSLALRLNAGPQTIGMTLGSKGQRVEWIEFAPSAAHAELPENARSQRLVRRTPQRLTKDSPKL